MYTRILIPTDGSELPSKAVQHGKTLIASPQIKKFDERLGSIVIALLVAVVIVSCALSPRFHHFAGLIIGALRAQ